MHRLLIADSLDAFALDVKRFLEDECAVKICREPTKILEDILDFKPDVLFYDPMFTQVSIETMMQLLLSAGIRLKAVSLCYVSQEYTYRQLWSGDIGAFIMRPCTVDHAVLCIRDLMFRMDHSEPLSWCLENELDSILLSLGFRMGSARYRCVFEAVRTRYYHPDFAMKALYVDVAKICGGNYQRIEKAIRDAVEDAYNCANKSLWSLYFMRSKRNKPHPSNEEFVGRIAGALTQLSRLHKTCSDPRTGTVEL